MPDSMRVLSSSFTNSCSSRTEIFSAKQRMACTELIASSEPEHQKVPFRLVIFPHLAVGTWPPTLLKRQRLLSSVSSGSGFIILFNYVLSPCQEVENATQHQVVYEFIYTCRVDLAIFFSIA